MEPQNQLLILEDDNNDVISPEISRNTSAKSHQKSALAKNEDSQELFESENTQINPNDKGNEPDDVTKNTGRVHCI